MPQQGPETLSASECISRNLAVVTPIDEARFIHILDQHFFDLLAAQKLRARAETRKYEEMYNYAMKAIKAGASVEPGLHEARIVTIHARAKRMPATQFEKLIFT